MKRYTVTAERLQDGQWETLRATVKGYRAALRLAKAMHAAKLGAVLLRSEATGRARFVES